MYHLRHCLILCVERRLEAKAKDKQNRSQANGNAN